MSLHVRLGRYPEGLLYNPDLPEDVDSCPGSHLAFADHFHCLVAFDGLQRTVTERTRGRLRRASSRTDGPAPGHYLNRGMGFE